MLYRISIDNNYENLTAFLEYRQYGNEAQLKVFSGCEVKSGQRVNVGMVKVFLNYNEVGCFRSKREARALLEKLVEEAPKEAIKDFREHFPIVFKSVL